MLIGLGGYAESGKDAVADILTEHGWFKTYMSKPLEQALLKLNPWILITKEDLGKLLETQPNFPLNQAPMRYVELHALVGYADSKKVAEVRRLLQILGTEIGREMFGQNVWVDRAFTEVRESLVAGLNVAITGIRFANEMRTLHEHYGRSVWVSRPGYGPVNTHSSDNTLGPEDFDVVLDNKGTLEDLRTLVLSQFPTEGISRGQAVSR